MRRKEIYRCVLCTAMVTMLVGCGSATASEETTIASETQMQTTEAPKSEYELMVENMKQNLELEEYFDEAVNLISSDEWSRVITKDFTFNDESGNKEMYIQANENESVVWFYKEDSTLVLKKTDNEVYVMKTTPDYNGEFSLWILNSETGDIYSENGTFVNGVLVGEYKVSFSKGQAASELFSLWSNRETMEYTEYVGMFDELGNTTVKQLEDDSKIIYAYDKTNENYLYAIKNEGIDEVVFLVKTLGVGELSETSNLIMRQFGAVEKEQNVQQQTQKPTQSATKPSTQKPAQKPTQAETKPSIQKPVEKPTQAPTQETEQEETQAPTQAPTVAPEPPSVDDGGNNSGDVDIEWSGDIL